MAHRDIDTALIHAGETSVEGAVSMPIFQTTTYGFRGAPQPLRYQRLSNSPNHEALHTKLAAITGAEAALVTSSGMSAIATTLLTVLKPGDHLIMQDCVYGGSRAFATNDLLPMGIEVDFAEIYDADALEGLRRPSTKAIYCESLTNPLLDVTDLPRVASFARAHGLMSICDNTFGTPVNVQPLEHGFDLVIHSASKYLGGHSDLIGGVVAGRAEVITEIHAKLVRFGGSLDPFACFLLHRGLKTLAVRVARQNETALSVARALAGHARVATVRYPGLPKHPDHERAQALLRGFGGVLSFEVVGGAEAAKRLLERLRVALAAPSLGGVETLVSLPSLTSHAGLEPAKRRAMGISDSLVRVSVGLESADDLVADLQQALE